MNVVLNRTVVVDSDRRFENLCGSHLQSQSPIHDYVHPDDQTQPTFEMTPGFKPFTVRLLSGSKIPLYHANHPIFACALGTHLRAALLTTYYTF